MSSVLRRIVTVCVALAAASASPTAARAQEEPSYKAIAKWDVSYTDLDAGQVRGVAFCKWDTDKDPSGSGASPAAKPHCKVRLRHPKTGELSELSADSTDIEQPSSKSPNLKIVLHGRSQGSSAVRYPGTSGASVAARGTKATIVLKNGDVEREFSAPVMSRAASDDATVTLDLSPTAEGWLIGRWSYLSDPITERDAHGLGRVGVFGTLNDSDVSRSAIPQRDGGFKGIQQGTEIWHPLPPHILGIHVLEDQAGFDGDAPQYPSGSLIRPGANDALRTLVVIGRDLPVLENESYQAIKSADADGLEYTVIADSRAKNLSDENKRRIARAFAAKTAGWGAQDADAYRKLDAVVVAVTQAGSGITPGPKTFAWGTAKGTWALQFGDNTATLRFIRITGRTEATSPPSQSSARAWRQQSTAAPAAQQEDSEEVVQLALPDRVLVEVRTGMELATDSIPIVLGGGALGGHPLTLVAARDSDTRTLYRTPSLVFSEIGVVPSDARSGPVVPVVKGAAVLAKVDDSKTHFLRARPAMAIALPPGRLWLNALVKASACDQLSVNEADWGHDAALIAHSITMKGQTVDITYGDRAAMLLLRDTYLASMRHHLAEIDKIAQEQTTSDEADHLIDAWYRNMSGAVQQTPLGEFEVSSPAGKVPFQMAYSSTFSNGTFQIGTTSDGFEKYRAWRRQASREALAFYRKIIADAITADIAIDDCSDEELLHLVGAGFIDPKRKSTDVSNQLALRITPLLMKVRDPTMVSVPDFLARAYVKNLDSLAERLQSVKEFSAQVNKAIVTSVAMLTGPGLQLGWGLIGVGAEGVGALGYTVGGLALFSYDAGTQIYDTYQEHEEISFAFDRSAALGLDRYFDAESRSTPWWQTGLKIFGEGVMTGVGMIPLSQQLYEGAQVWNGARVAGELEQGAIANWSSLSDTARREAIRDLAYFELRQEEYLAQRSIVSPVGAAARSILRRLYAAIGGAPAPESSAIGDALEGEAINALTAARDSAPPLLREAEPKMARAEIANQANIAEHEGEAQALVDIATLPQPPPSDEVTHILKPFPVDEGLPRGPGRWTISIRGADGEATKVKINVEAMINSGTFQHVYKITGSPEGLPVPLIPALRNKKVLAMKIIKQPDAILRDILEKAPNSPFAELENVRLDVAKRMKIAETLLGSGKQQVVPHAEFQVFESEGIVFQEYLEPKKGQLEFLPTSESDLSKLSDDRRVAVAKLVKKFIDAGIKADDFHPANIYLEKENEEWIAKLLDPDFVYKVGEPRTAGTEEFYEFTRVNNPSSDLAGAWDSRRPAANAPDTEMMKVLERKGWLTFSLAKKMTVKGYLHPEDFANLVQWPFFKPEPELPEFPPTPIPLADFGDLSKMLKSKAPGQPERIRLPNGPR
jgi:hypothetical protein